MRRQHSRRGYRGGGEKKEKKKRRFPVPWSASRDDRCPCMKSGRRARHGRRRAGQEKAIDSTERKATRRLSSAGLMPLVEAWLTRSLERSWSHWGM